MVVVVVLLVLVDVLVLVLVTDQRLPPRQQRPRRRDGRSWLPHGSWGLSVGEHEHEHEHVNEHANEYDHDYVDGRARARGC